MREDHWLRQRPAEEIPYFIYELLEAIVADLSNLSNAVNALEALVTNASDPVAEQAAIDTMTQGINDFVAAHQPPAPPAP